MKQKSKEILNRKELNEWMARIHARDGDLVHFESVQDIVTGIYDSDFGLVINPVNIAWIDKNTGERFDLIWG